MELKALALYTIDTKDGRILEINPMEVSYLKPLDRTAGGDFIGKYVTPALKAKLPEHNVIYAASGGNFDEDLSMEIGARPKDWSGVIIPGAAVNLETLLEAKFYPQIIIGNATFVHFCLMHHKGLLADLSSKTLANRLPYTQNYKAAHNPERIKALADRISKAFEGADKLVIKPTNENQGKGVVIIDRDNIQQELDFLFCNKAGQVTKASDDKLYAQAYWSRVEEPLFQVQEFIQDRPFRHKGHQWDGTRRYACITLVGKNEQGLPTIETDILGGFIKLPREPINENNDVSQDNRISFSFPRGMKERLSRLFHLVTAGSGDRVLLSHAEVMADTQNIREDLNAVFEYLEGLDVNAYLNDLNSSSDPAKRQLAQELKNNFIAGYPSDSLRKALYSYDEDYTDYQP